MVRLLILWMKVGCVQGEMSSDARHRLSRKQSCGGSQQRPPAG